MEIKKEQLIATRISETRYKDFKIECINRGLSIKQAMAQAIDAWLLTKPDQKRLPISTFGLIENKSKIKKIRGNG